MRNVLEEKGSFTIEATIICVFIMAITIYVIISVIKIYDNSLENRIIEEYNVKQAINIIE